MAIATDPRLEITAYVREGPVVYRVIGMEKHCYVLEDIHGEYSSGIYVHRQIVKSAKSISERFVLVKAATEVPAGMVAEMVADLECYLDGADLTADTTDA